MRQRFQPVRLHSSVHDDDPCQCHDCVALRGRLTQMIDQPGGWSLESTQQCRSMGRQRLTEVLQSLSIHAEVGVSKP